MRYMLIAFPLAILIDCIAFVNFFQWQQQSVYEFWQRQYDLQVNYAVDAATQEMLSDSTHISTDYAEWGAMTVEPEVALRTFQAVLLRNLGWADSEKNREDLMEDHVPFFLVAAYDGYYLYCRQHEMVQLTSGGVWNSAYNFHWTPKIPYSTAVNSSGNISGTLDASTFYYLGREQYGILPLGGSGIAGVTGLKRGLYLKSGGKYYEDPYYADQVIADTLTSAMNSALYTGLQGNVDQHYYIPAQMSEWSKNNPVLTPTCLTYMSNRGGVIKYDTTSFGIGGAKIDEADFVVCYKRNGIKCYGWASDRDKIINSGIDNSLVNKGIIEILPTPEIAASSGYYFDIQFYRR